MSEPKHAIVTELYRHDFTIPLEMLDEILALGSDVVPDLESVLEAAYGDAGRYADLSDEEGCSVLHAVFLLGELGSRRSFPRILDFLRQEEEVIEFWFGDVLTEDLWEVVVQCGQDAIAETEAFLTDPSVYLFAKAAISRGLAQLALHIPERREEVAEAFRRILRSYLALGRTSLTADDAANVGYLVSDALDAGLREVEPEIRQAFEARIVDRSVVGADEGFHGRPAVDELSHIRERYERYRRVFTGGDVERGPASMPPTTYVRPEPKVGRNDPCPCGSGKKSKKCCGG